MSIKGLLKNKWEGEKEGREGLRSKNLAGKEPSRLSPPGETHCLQNKQCNEKDKGGLRSGRRHEMTHKHTEPHLSPSRFPLTHIFSTFLRISTSLSTVGSSKSCTRKLPFLRGVSHWTQLPEPRTNSISTQFSHLLVGETIKQTIPSSRVGCLQKWPSSEGPERPLGACVCCGCWNTIFHTVKWICAFLCVNDHQAQLVVMGYMNIL